MATQENTPPRDCLSCRIVGGVGLVGIGGYLANSACKHKTLPGKYGLSVLSFAFICLGVARYKQTFPFNKNAEFKTRV
uniref:SFRICE_016690 n=1 Tax=Spodoptera frugiperda TaxID=7108 RepID=A0A2H1VJ47_SPOFR